MRPPEGPWSATHQRPIPFVLRETVGWVIIWQQRQADDIDSGARERPAGVCAGLIYGPNNVQSMVTVTNREPSLCPRARLPMPPINAATLSPA